MADRRLKKKISGLWIANLTQEANSVWRKNRKTLQIQVFCWHTTFWLKKFWSFRELLRLSVRIHRLNHWSVLVTPIRPLIQCPLKHPILQGPNMALSPTSTMVSNGDVYGEGMSWNYPTGKRSPQTHQLQHVICRLSPGHQLCSGHACVLRFHVEFLSRLEHAVSLRRLSRSDTVSNCEQFSKSGNCLAAPNIPMDTVVICRPVYPTITSDVWR